MVRLHIVPKLARYLRDSLLKHFLDVWLIFWKQAELELLSKKDEPVNKLDLQGRETSIAKAISECIVDGKVNVLGDLKLARADCHRILQGKYVLIDEDTFDCRPFDFNLVDFLEQ